MIRERLRQKKEIDICSDWSLLRKIGQKRMVEALTNAGHREIEQYVLAWNCFKEIYVPERSSSTRKLSDPKSETWRSIANLYNRERSRLNIIDSAIPKDLEQWMLICVKAVRDYLFPRHKSLNQPKPGYETGEIVDSIVGNVDESLLADMITSEEVEQRTQQHKDINQFLMAQIARLKPEERELLRLYYDLDLTQTEIAAKLNTKQYSICRKLAKVRKTLLKALVQWSESTMHISLTSDIIDNISSLLEEWLANHYDSNQKNL